MDLTPEVLRGFEFRRKGRGYETEDVDAFRQQVEVGVAEIQARLREATSKLDEAETRAREAEERNRTSVESDETIQRTLLLAQRTADAAVAEAEETAGRKVAEAEAEAERLVTEARTHRDRAIANAEAEVREAIDLKRAELLDELTSLERVRDAFTGDVAALEAHVEAQRTRLEEARDLLGAALEQPLAPVPPPTLSGAEVPEPTPEVALTALSDPVEDEVAAEGADPRDDVEPVATDEAADVAEDPWAPAESVFGETPAVTEPAADDVDGASWTATEDAWADTPPPPPPPPPDLEVDEAAWAEAPPPPPPPPPDFDAPVAEAETAVFGGLSGPAVPEQLPPLDEGAEEHNPWLAELADQESGGEGERSRFGRRR